MACNMHVCYKYKLILMLHSSELCRLQHRSCFPLSFVFKLNIWHIYMFANIYKPYKTYIFLFAGCRLKGIHVKHAGVATHFVKSDKVHTVCLTKPYSKFCN